MTVGELKKWLQDNNIPDDAYVSILSDAALTHEQVGAVYLTKSVDDDPLWEFEEYEDWYDEEWLAQYRQLNKITGVCLHGA